MPRLRLLGPLALAVVLVGAVCWYAFAFGGFSVRGVILDGAGGQPIPGARVWSPRMSATTGPDGTFLVGGLKPTEALGFDAPGYHAQTVKMTSPFDPITLRLEPIGVEIHVSDADAGQSVSAQVSGPGGTLATADGGLRIAPVRSGEHFAVRADGYLPAETTYDGQDVLNVPLRPKLDGYRRASIDVRQRPNLDITLQPNPVRATGRTPGGSEA